MAYYNQIPEYHPTTKKMKRFQETPMGDKLVSAVGGIGPKTAEKLNQAGFYYASIFRSFCLLCLFVYILLLIFYI